MSTRSLDGARVLVAGASGVLGGRIGDALAERGARLVAAGRDTERTAARAEAWGTSPMELDIVDEASCRAAVVAAREQLGGLDGVVVAVGAPAFSPAADLDGAVAEELLAVNALGPIGLLRAAAPELAEDGFVAAISAILVDAPMAGMADYGAAKAALSHWLTAARREWRPRTVLDVRPPHMDTGFADRPLTGEAPRLPAGFEVDRLVAAVVRGIEEGAREVVWDARAKDLRVD